MVIWDFREKRKEERHFPFSYQRNQSMNILHSTLILCLSILLISTMAATNSISATKLAIRTSMRQTLAAVHADLIEQQSRTIVSQMISLPEFQACTAMSVFISMKAEVQTKAIIEAALAHDKKVFIPKVIGKGAPDMIMVRLPSYAHIEHFPKNKWGIPEPDVSEDQGMDQIDFVVVPGVAFTPACERLGHGKGYYGNDCYFVCVQFDFSWRVLCFCRLLYWATRSCSKEPAKVSPSTGGSGARRANLIKCTHRGPW